MQTQVKTFLNEKDTFAKYLSEDTTRTIVAEVGRSKAKPTFPGNRATRRALSKASPRGPSARFTARKQKRLAEAGHLFFRENLGCLNENQAKRLSAYREIKGLS